MQGLTPYLFRKRRYRVNDLLMQAHQLRSALDDEDHHCASSPNDIIVTRRVQRHLRQLFSDEDLRECGGHRVEVLRSHEALQQRDMRHM
jgi:hypothetical protein